MKNNLLLALLFALATYSINAQEINFEVSPESPTKLDPVLLTVSQMFPTPCYTSRASVNRTGHVIEVEIHSEPRDVICIQVLSPQRVTIDLGELDPGRYVVNVHWLGAPVWGSDSAAFSFEVRKDHPIVLTPFQAIGLRFPTEVNKRYRVQSSPDMESWEDFGEIVTGNGGEIVVYDSMENHAKRFYRVVQMEAE